MRRERPVCASPSAWYTDDRTIGALERHTPIVQIAEIQGRMRYCGRPDVWRLKNNPSGRGAGLQKSVLFELPGLICRESESHVTESIAEDEPTNRTCERPETVRPAPRLRFPPPCPLERETVRLFPRQAQRTRTRSSLHKIRSSPDCAVVAIELCRSIRNLGRA